VSDAAFGALIYFIVIVALTLIGSVIWVIWAMIDDRKK